MKTFDKWQDSTIRMMPMMLEIVNYIRNVKNQSERHSSGSAIAMF